MFLVCVKLLNSLGFLFVKWLLVIEGFSHKKLDQLILVFSDRIYRIFNDKPLNIDLFFCKKYLVYPVNPV